MSSSATKCSVVLAAATVAATGASLAMATPAEAATNATWSKGILAISGDSAANIIVVGRNAGGHIKVNGGSVKIRGGQRSSFPTSWCRSG